MQVDALFQAQALGWTGRYPETRGALQPPGGGHGGHFIRRGGHGGTHLREGQEAKEQQEEGNRAST